jgi:hypothetical protein
MLAEERVHCLSEWETARIAYPGEFIEWGQGKVETYPCVGVSQPLDCLSSR